MVENRETTTTIGELKQASTMQFAINTNMLVATLDNCIDTSSIDTVGICGEYMTTLVVIVCILN